MKAFKDLKARNTFAIVLVTSFTFTLWAGMVLYVGEGNSLW